MVDHADVVVESFRPGVMDKLGINWKVLKRSTGVSASRSAAGKR
jgi:crotonobetainyl-CoA:carnitine CoA-transferase CaiB-like acyl-CoA transferase